MKIKTYIFPILGILLFSNCDNEASDILFPLEGTWHLVHKTGGFAGVDCEYQKNLIVWTFNRKTVEIVNNDSSKTFCSVGLGGISDYSVLAIESKLFFILDEWEIGRLTITEDEMIIDSNERSQGALSDGGSLTFIR